MKRKLLGAGVAIAVVAALAGSADAASRGGSGLVTLRGVGALRLGISSPADLRRFAGRPSQRVALSGGTAANGTEYATEDFEYFFPRNGIVEYYFANPGDGWILDGFDTSLKRFRTAHGTRVGMSLQEARRREHLHRVIPTCPWSALQHRSGNTWLDVGIQGSRVAGLAVFGTDYPPGC